MEEKDGVLKVHSTISKKARGKFLTELIKNKVSLVEEMKKIKFDGFEFSKEHSEEKECEPSIIHNNHHTRHCETSPIPT